MSRSPEPVRGTRRLARRTLVGAVVAALGWLAIAGFAADPVAAAPPAAPAGSAAMAANTTCAFTGYSTANDAALDKLVARLESQTAFQTTGTPLAPGGTWTVPAGRVAVLVIDHEQPSTTYREDLSVAGVHTWSATGAATGHRWITGKLPSAQSWTRTIGVSADVANCRAAITMTSGRGPLGTQVCRIGAALLVICTIVALFVGRGRSRITSTFAAIPFGILAGLGLSAVLYESGRLDPYGHGVLAAPVIGLVLALALPWSRRPDRSATTVTTDRDLTAGGDRTGDPEAVPSTPQPRVDDDGRPVAVAAPIPAPAGAAAASEPVNEPAAAAVSADHEHDPESTIEPTPAPTLAAALSDAPLRSGSGRTVRVVAAVVAGIVSAGAVAVIGASRPDQAAATASIDPAAANVISPQRGMTCWPAGPRTSMTRPSR